ncbi:MAG TPA: hypothetical protein PKK10_16860 [Woeseiaceae bacterium]|nr:hypothetical protein [Woeseiaceae bacterium]
MSRKTKRTDAPESPLKNESARQRWELFHRAIAHAKQLNDEALIEADDKSSEPGSDTPPLLSVVR